MYDAAGNLINDGTAAATYDALNRTTARGTTTYTYTGDGTLVSQATGGVTTRYTQDLAAPLSQVLQTQVGAAARTDYLYGANRLATLTSGVRTWYASDALGSVRRTVSAAGVPLGVVTYDPWGSVETGAVPTFGFTGELQQGGDVYLRARWYHAAEGRFASVDPAAGRRRRRTVYIRTSMRTQRRPCGVIRVGGWLRQTTVAGLAQQHVVLSATHGRKDIVCGAAHGQQRMRRFAGRLLQ